jgi:hypothetical protein
MIRHKLNLACEKGHRWYAPNPDAWVGRTCGRSHGDARNHGCQGTLYAQKDQRPG